MRKYVVTGHATLAVFAATAGRVQGLPLDQVCAALAVWVEKVSDRLTEREMLEIVELGAVLWQEASRP